MLAALGCECPALANLSMVNAGHLATLDQFPAASNRGDRGQAQTSSDRYFGLRCLDLGEMLMFDRFVAVYPSDGRDVSPPVNIEPLRQVPGLAELATPAAGCSFGNGVLRVFTDEARPGCTLRRGKMPGRAHIGASADAARALFASRTPGGSIPSQGDFFEVLKQFERMEFDVPDSADADGFLFQWSPASWLPEPAFTVGITRQLEVVGSDGEHETYLQVSMDFLYALDRDLESLASGSSWWFRGSGDSFTVWLDAVRNNLAWVSAEGKLARKFVVSSDEE